MASLWSERELSTLSQNLHDGFPINSMTVLIPTRGIGAIKQKAQDFGFGVTTSKEDGITRFYENIKSRVRGANALSEINEVSRIINTIEAAQPQQAMPSNDIDHLEPETRIVPYDGLSANTLAVRMLTENGLSVDPDIVHTLSLYILKEQR